ncbi:MAG: hypothetical protein WHV66_06770 [Anaerolineales bacterium]
MMQGDLIWTLVGFILTLLVFSYLFGDNVLFRLAVYVFVGVTSGYVVVLLVDQVLVPRLVTPLMQGSIEQRLLLVIPLILSILLVTKLFPRLAAFGNLSLGVMVGIGAAVIVGGALQGTLASQITAAVTDFNLQSGVLKGRDPVLKLIEALILLVGTISTLVYFQFGATAKPNQPPRRPRWIEMLAGTGQIFIGITLGSLFAGVFAAALTALIDRLDFITLVIYDILF